MNPFYNNHKLDVILSLTLASPQDVRRTCHVVIFLTSSVPLYVCRYQLPIFEITNSNRSDNG